jgi:hypothetical protein
MYNKFIIELESTMYNLKVDLRINKRDYGKDVMRYVKKRSILKNIMHIVIAIETSLVI